MDTETEEPLHVSHARRLVMPFAFLLTIISATAYITWDRASLEHKMESHYYMLTRDVKDITRQVSGYEQAIHTAQKLIDDRSRKVEDIHEQVSRLSRDMDQVKRDMSTLKKAAPRAP